MLPIIPFTNQMCVCGGMYFFKKDLALDNLQG